MQEKTVSKSALVTGAGKRIGREIALHLARCGWDVAIHCRHSVDEAEEVAKEIHNIGRRTAIVLADFANAEEVSTLIERASDYLGQLSLLVHNAAAFEKEGLANFSHQNFTAQMAVNLEAPLHLTRDFAVQAPTGSNVVCLLDGMTGWSMSAAYLSYALSKQGLEEAVRLLARTLAPTVRINGIALGASLAGKEDEADTFMRLAGMAPLQRTGETPEILSALDFILAAPGMTGQVVNIANGMAAPPLLARDVRRNETAAD